MVSRERKRVDSDLALPEDSLRFFLDEEMELGKFHENDGLSEKLES